MITTRLPLLAALLTVALLTALAGPSTAPAQSFRVETEVFLNDQREPVAETLTLFNDGRVYDFIFGSSRQVVEVTVYDVKNARFYLIDVQRELRTEVTAAELAAFSAAIKARAAADDDAVRELVMPQFEETFDETTGRLTLSSPRIEYQVKCRKSDANAARQYNQFADWYARLNATRPGNPPPFARLDLDQAMSSRDLIPDTVERIYRPANRLFGKTQTARTKHLFTWRILETDRERIAAAQRHQSRFKAVDFASYRNIASIAKSD